MSFSMYLDRYHRYSLSLSCFWVRFLTDIKYQLLNMVKHIQEVHRQKANELFECAWPFVELAPKGLTDFEPTLLVTNF